METNLAIYVPRLGKICEPVVSGFVTRIISHRSQQLICRNHVSSVRRLRNAILRSTARSARFPEGETKVSAIAASIRRTCASA